jgi:hypothetical protein
MTCSKNSVTGKKIFHFHFYLPPTISIIDIVRQQARRLYSYDPSETVYRNRIHDQLLARILILPLNQCPCPFWGSRVRGWRRIWPVKPIETVFLIGGYTNKSY